MAVLYSIDFSTYFVAPPLDNILANGENWDLVSTPSRQTLGIPGWLDIVADPLGQRGNVLRCVINDTDPDTAGTAEGVSKRAECNLPNTDFTEHWYSFDVLIQPGDWPASQDFSIFQHHKQDTPNSAQPLGILVGREALSVQFPIGGTMPSTADVFSVDVVRVAPFTYGVWHRVTLHALWSISTSGYREIFLDGARVWRQGDVITAYDDAISGYAKIGLYNLRSNATPGWGTCRAYFSNLSVWNGPASYANGLNGPMLPVPKVTLPFWRG